VILMISQKFLLNFSKGSLAKCNQKFANLKLNESFSKSYLNIITMKKIILLLFWGALMNITCSAQLKVIDQVVGSLIPATVNGIKSVLATSNNKGKIDSSQVGALRTKVQTELNGVINQMTKDEANIDILNKIFLKTSGLLGHISSMRTICTEEILNPMHSTPNVMLDRQIIKLFQSNWATFEDQIADLSSIPDAGNNPTLQAQLNFFSTQVGSNLKSLKSDIQFGSTANITTKDEDVIKYLDNLNSSSVRSELDLIILQISQLNTTLSAYISSFSASLKDGKAAVKNSQ
jgi:hypothetical protein